MKVGRAAFYAWRRGETYQPTPRQAEIDKRVRECFWFHQRRYGSRRLAVELKLGRKAVRSSLKREKLQAIAPKRFRPRTTDSRHFGIIAPNLLQENEATGKGEALVGDITYLPLRGGKFAYLACYQDKYTRRIAGWKISARMTTQLVLDAFNQARRRGKLNKGAIVHSDRGSQYAAVEYRRLLYLNGFRRSMSGKGNCYDNAQAESFFSRFKAELVEGGVFENIEQAKSEVFSYIEGYYNRVRRHSSLGYLSPLEFEKKLELKTKIKRRRSERSVSRKT